MSDLIDMWLSPLGLAALGYSAAALASLMFIPIGGEESGLGEPWRTLVLLAFLPVLATGLALVVSVGLRVVFVVIAVAAVAGIVIVPVLLVADGVRRLVAFVRGEPSVPDYNPHGD